MMPLTGFECGSLDSLLAVGFGLVYALPLLLRGVQYFWVGEGKDLSSQQTGS